MYVLVNGRRKVACRDIHDAVHLLEESSLIRRRSVYGIIQSEEGVLLVRNRHASGGRWDLPGGGVQGHEQEIEALAREIAEETGLSLAGEPHRVCGLLERFYDLVTGCGWESERWYFVAECRGQIMSDGNDEVLEVGYFRPPSLSWPVPLTTRGIVEAFWQRWP